MINQELKHDINLKLEQKSEFYYNLDTNKYDIESFNSLGLGKITFDLKDKETINFIIKDKGRESQSMIDINFINSSLLESCVDEFSKSVSGLSFPFELKTKTDFLNSVSRGKKTRPSQGQKFSNYFSKTFTTHRIR